MKTYQAVYKLTVGIAIVWGVGMLVAAQENLQASAEDHDDHGGHEQHQGHEDHDGHVSHDDHADHDEHAGHDDHASHNGHDDHASHEGHDDHASHNGHDDHAGHDEHDDEGIIRLTPEVMREFDIPLKAAAAGKLAVTLSFPGEVHVNGDRQAHIAPRYPGLVTSVLKKIGDQVERGEVLAIIEGNESLATYKLTSLIDGTIIEKHITLGESLSYDHMVFTVADLDSVWIDLMVYQQDLPLVQTKQRVSISAGEHLPTAEGEIVYVSPTVDEHTRTGLARIVLPNLERVWRPGTFVTGQVEISTSDALVVIPREAVISVEGRPSVFVQTGKGLEARAVTIGVSDGTRYEILKGLKPGEQYVTRNALPLKAELNRAALEHAGHAH